MLQHCHIKACQVNLEGAAMSTWGLSLWSYDMLAEVFTAVCAALEGKRRGFQTLLNYPSNTPYAH